jgi:hypothetical protein
MGHKDNGLDFAEINLATTLASCKGYTHAVTNFSHLLYNLIV